VAGARADPPPPRAQVGDTLAEFLVDATPDPKLRQVMMSMAEAIRTIAFKVRAAAALR
jgi:sedoheptulose-bisphosphatase